MEIIFIEAAYQGKVELTKEAIAALKQYKTIAVFSSVQFAKKLDKIVSQLEKEKIKVLSSSPERASIKYQLLGCDVYYKNLKLNEDPDAFLYIGDGMFHPQAIAIAQKDKESFKPIICYDPISNRSTTLTRDSIKKIIQKSKYSYAKFLTSDIIGVLISTKYGQEHHKLAKSLAKKYPKKKFYLFLDDNISLGQLDNFPFIQAWVNTACPRIALDDILDIRSAVVNINEVK